jgi:hypothetical protein
VLDDELRVIHGNARHLAADAAEAVAKMFFD